MTRKTVIAAALAIAALFSSIGIGTAEAHWVRHPGWGYYHVWGPRYYYAYHVAPYYIVQPRCFVTVYGTTYCY